jgi:sulfite exporter TauE/SafE
MLKEALFLGLSTGTYCAMFCAPVVLPFIFSEDLSSGRRNARYIGLFLGGRLLGYLAVGALLGAAGAYIIGYVDPLFERRISSIAYILIGIIMLVTGLVHSFPGRKFCVSAARFSKPDTNALALGILTGLKICPPFFAAASRVFATGAGMSQGMLYFALFFAGTSVYFLPLFGAHYINRHLGFVRMISRLVMILLGVYFILVLGLLKLS